MILDLDAGARVIIRPSGTEPKIKAYLEVRAAVGADGVRVARAHAQARLTAVADTVRERLGGSIAYWQGRSISALT